MNRDSAEAGKNANSSSGWSEDDEPDVAQSSSWALHALPDVGSVRRMLAMPASERSHKARRTIDSMISTRYSVISTEYSIITGTLNSIIGTACPVQLCAPDSG